MSKRYFTVFVLVTGLLLLMGTVAAAESDPVEIVVAQGADAVTLDPHGENDQPSSRVRSQIYDTLVLQDADLNLKPGLAEEWEEIDELTWEFKLREGVEFHNGEPLTADDVKFTLDRLRDPETAAPGAFIVGFLEEVEVVDTHTVRLVCDEPFAPLLNHLAHPVTGILNKKAVEEAGDDYGTRVAIGTGPFVFVDWSTGSHIDLERFEGYWGEPARADRIRFRNIPEDVVRAIELETGGTDISYGLDPVGVESLEAHPDVRVVKHDTLSTHYIGFNADKEPFNDVRVRQAINHAVDVEAVVDYVYTGLASRATGPISENVWGANQDLVPFEFDLDRARELLEEAGYPEGFSTTIWTNDNPQRMQIAEMIQSDLAKIGIDVEIEVLEWGTYLEETAQGNHDMFILGWVSVTGDADYGLYSLFHSSQYGGPGNRTFWSDPRVDELLDRGRTSADPDVRFDAYYEAQGIIAEEAPWLFLIVTQEANGLRSDVVGFEPHPAGHHCLRGVTRE